MAYQLLDVDLGGGSVLQYANRDPYQMMGYLLKTPEGKTVMIDGGRWEGADAAYLHELILKEGGRVDLWLITHAHDDHFSALSCILRDNDRLDFEIGDMRICFPPLEWLKTVENGNGYGPAAAFLERLQKHSIETTPLRRGDVLTCGGLTIDVLHDCENYVNYNNINDTGAVLRVHYPNRDILFLADIDVQAAKELMELYTPEQLQCDIVQLAHHGQDGAHREFYEIVRPKIALYAAPLWLWTNNDGTGPFKTLETRQWMRDLGVVLSCPHCHGDYLLV
jgi:beta-lactamase superfamily II metal-dependent hydrolase